MTERERGGVELLVHASAPSRGKDDAHYRALASGYLLFEPVNRLSLHDDNGNNRLSASKAHVDRQSHNLPLDLPRDKLRGPTMFIDVDDENIYDVSQSQGQAPSGSHITRSNANLSLESPQASFSSVLDNLNSPVLPTPGRTVKTPPPSAKRKTDHSVVDNESSWDTPPSVIPDSQSPYNRVLPEFSSPTRILELYLQHFDASGSVPATTDTSSCSQASSINLFLDSSQPHASSPPQTTPPFAPRGTDESLQIIRDTPSAAYYTKSKSPRSIRRKLYSPQKPAVSPVAGGGTGLAGPLRYHVPSARPTPQTSPLLKRRKVEVPATIKIPSQRKTSKFVVPSRISPNEIHPPPPRTSSWGPKPPLLITPAFQLLAVQLELPLRYRPKCQTRPLRDLERGYWAVETEHWPNAVRDQAWVALGAYLGQGRAGWGVWAVRGDVWKNVAGEGGEQPWLRVYCWGGVAGHVYLLLYLVSQRRVKGTGASWVDGGGEVVVRMP